VSVPLAQGQVAAHFPAANVANYRAITQDTLAKVQDGDQAGATARIKDLETAWDDDQAKLQPMDGSTWTAIDGRIDAVLTALRAGTPDPTNEKNALNDLLTALR
jgi:hypothetical protein